jgi:biopolymer transport protein ExbB
MNILEFIDKGGVIVYILIALNIIGFSIIIFKLIHLYQFKAHINLAIEEILLKVNSCSNKSNYIDTIIQSKVKKLENGLNTIKIIATVSPLLGLLGTVIGILSSFDNISKLGLDDPSIFSSSISLALITTVVGLLVSIPHYIFYNYFIGVLDNYELKLKNKVLEKL